MTRSHENRCFRRFQQTRDPRLLGKVFDATAPELLRVAGHLSNGDRELTQDALQATFLTAIEQADRYDAERDVRPWLLGILANHVRKERRTADKGRGVDVAEVGLAAGDSPVAEVQRAEFGTAARTAMKRLPSPFREAIVLHLQHGLTANEIGEALGRPAGTVRTQLVRGMERLRTLLPAGFTAAALGMVLTPGPILAAVRANVLASLPAVATAGGASSLVLSGWRLYAMTAAVMTLVLSYLLAVLSADPPAVPGEVARAQDGVPVAARAAVASERELVEGRGPAAAEQPEQQRPAAGEDLQRVALKLVYHDGKPAAFAQVALRVNGMMKRWDADARGRIELNLPWPGFYNLFVVGTHIQKPLIWFDGLRRPRVVKERIVLEAGMTLDLRVVDEQGDPVPGAHVESSHGFAFEGTMLTTVGRADGQGRYVHDHVGTRGQLRVWADGFLPSRIVDANGKVGERCERTITLRSGAHAARGVVVDEAGRVLAGARLALVQLGALPDEPLMFAADAAGAFRLATLRTGRHALVGVHDDGTLRRGLVRFEHHGKGDVDVELVLSRGARVVGRLVDANGVALAGTNVVARDRPEAIRKLPFLETWTRTQRDGTFVLSSLVPGGYELESEHVPSQLVTLREGEEYRWDAARVGLETISLRLLDALGNPLEGWMVHELYPDSDAPSRGTITGADGRFHEHHSGWQHPAGTFRRYALHRPLGRSEEKWRDHSRLPNYLTPPLRVGVEHEIRVPDAARTVHVVTGEVVDANGVGVGGAKVSFYSGYGNVVSVAVETGADGTFRREGMPPGRYRVAVQAAGKPWRSFRNLDVRGAATCSLGRLEVGDVGVIVVDVTGAGGDDGLRLRLVDERGDTHRLRRQQDGTWRSRSLFFGDYELQGWSGTLWLAPSAISLRRSEQRAEAVFVAHRASTIEVELPHDHPRNSSAWIADLVATRGGKRVFDLRVRHRFRGVYRQRFTIEVPLPPGQLQLEFEGWLGRKGRATVTVPPTGGGRFAVRIE
ncbi:MAG: sigma-70 family RNA polymerase sigma factor [Planctomycetota bacterium]